MTVVMSASSLTESKWFVTLLHISQNRKLLYAFWR